MPTREPGLIHSEMLGPSRTGLKRPRYGRQVPGTDGVEAEEAVATRQPEEFL